jgi:hypothetical protein
MSVLNKARLHYHMETGETCSETITDGIEELRDPTAFADSGEPYLAITSERLPAYIEWLEEQYEKLSK